MDILELDCYFDVDGDGKRLSPFTIRFVRENLTAKLVISAHLTEDGKPCPGAVEKIKEIENFSHGTCPKESFERTAEPTKITLFLESEMVK